ncbi:MAG: glutamate 5-kinase [Oscillospiraceae bacterium]|nr:glutamate 5-kinase [Oscillospiraceae bacterium]
MKLKKRIVVKVGTSTIISKNGKANLSRLKWLALVLSDLQKKGDEVVLVTSGSIGLGASALEKSLSGRDKALFTLAQKQAAAAVGQSRLMRLYSECFSKYDKTVAQILLTRGDLDQKERRGALLNTINTLISCGILPIVNENDSVCPEEISDKGVFGDNDTLSAEAARLIKADLLVLLTDTDGFYTSDPNSDIGATKINRVCEITDDLRSSASGTGTARGTGGMQTKLDAGEIALDGGFDMVIAHGGDPTVLYAILSGEDAGTLFRR